MTPGLCLFLFSKNESSFIKKIGDWALLYVVNVYNENLIQWRVGKISNEIGSNYVLKLR